ncbi:MAG: prokaryotic E2 ligase family D protein [Scytonema hyalinum WJT4-NPBG1]|jgi:PRTRC genetic system protein B|nr:prokaryotic E2 ligase family D protein [Scytonema hyalinum WJT4-NPBG1]
MNTEVNAQPILSNIPTQEILGHLIILKGQFVLVEKEGNKTQHKFLSPEAVEKAFTTKTVSSGWLSPNTLWWEKTPSGEGVIQFYPPQKYSVSIQTSEENKTITIPMPAFLFAGCNSSYYLWAIKGKTFKQDCQLYKAPLPNIWDDSNRICFGRNTPPACNPNSINKAWELFWRSPFNEDFSQNKCKSHLHNVCNLLISLQGTRSFPAKELVTSNYQRIKTPNDICRYIFQHE